MCSRFNTVLYVFHNSVIIHLTCNYNSTAMAFLSYISQKCLSFATENIMFLTRVFTNMHILT